MTVSLEQQAVVVSGRCGVEEVETLVSHLEGHPGLLVDLSEATEIHTSLWQALLFFQPAVTRFPSASPMSAKLLLVVAAKLAKPG